MQTWLTAAATPTAAAEQIRCEQRPRDFVHLIAVTTALHNRAQTVVQSNNVHTKGSVTMRYIHLRLTLTLTVQLCAV